MSTETVSSTQAATAGVPKQIVNAQTVCNVKNEKGKLCNGHLKQLQAGQPAEVHLRGDDVLFKCQSCGTLYMGPPLGHVRDPQKQSRFVEKELTELLQAAGGTLPAFKRSPSGAWVPVNEPEGHGHAATAKPAAKPATAKPAGGEVIKPGTATKSASPAAKAAPAAAPATNETPEEKRLRLARVVAEAKLKSGKITQEEFDAMIAEGKIAKSPAASAAAAPAARTAPATNPTSGTDSSPSADAHRPAAEAQAATGQASAAPLSPAAANASPAAGAETPADLAPDASTEKSPAAPRAAAGKGTPAASNAPPAGETHEEKIARLKRVVEEAKRKAGKL